MSARTVTRPLQHAVSTMPTASPLHPAFTDTNIREHTFHNWPREDHPIADRLVQALARAGFFYQGDGDYVRCFHCNGTLASRHWKDGQNPLQMHVERNPHCHFAGRKLREGNLDEGAQPRFVQKYRDFSMVFNAFSWFLMSKTVIQYTFVAFLNI